MQVEVVVNGGTTVLFNPASSSIDNLVYSSNVARLNSDGTIATLVTNIDVSGANSSLSSGGAIVVPLTDVTLTGLSAGGAVVNLTYDVITSRIDTAGVVSSQTLNITRDVPVYAASQLYDSSVLYDSAGLYD